MEQDSTEKANNLGVLSSALFIKTPDGSPKCIAMPAIRACTHPLLVKAPPILLLNDQDSLLAAEEVQWCARGTKRVNAASIPCALVPPPDIRSKTHNAVHMVTLESVEYRDSVSDKISGFCISSSVSIESITICRTSQAEDVEDVAAAPLVAADRPVVTAAPPPPMSLAPVVMVLVSLLF